MNGSTAVNPRLFFVVSAFNQFGGSLTSVILLTLATINYGAQGAVLIWIAFYVAVSMGGMLAHILGRHLTGLLAIFVSEIARAILLLPIVVFPDCPLLLLCATQFAIWLLESVYHPNRYSFINQMFPEQKQKAEFLAHLQTFDSIAGVIGPVFAGLLILSVSYRVGLLLDIATYVVSAVYWRRMSYERNLRHLPRSNLMAGFRALLDNSQVRNVNVARILSNALFVFWGVFLPTAVVHGIGVKYSSLAYGVSAGAMAAGIAIGGYGISRYIRNSHMGSLRVVIWLAALAVFFAGLAMLPAVYERAVGFAGIAMIASLLGVAIASARTVIVVAGQQVTPAPILHLVMAAGDSVVRILSAALAMMLGVLVNANSGGGLALLYILALACLSSLAGLRVIALVERAMPK